MSEPFRDAMIAQMPALKAFAATKSRSRSEADDLVQETLSRALRYSDSFTPGTNMKSWLFKIMQNCRNRALSKGRDTVQDVEGYWASQQSIPPAQEWRIQYSDVIAALRQLTPDAREALMLVGADGCSYEEAAERSDCAVGTMKSRVNRARERLAELTGRSEIRRPAAPAPCSPTFRDQTFREQAHQMSYQPNTLPDIAQEDSIE